MTFDADGVRATFTEFFTERGHVLVPSAGLVPHHPGAPMFTNAGMNQFIGYFTGEEIPPYPRATSVQKCVRVRGKHDDVELIGRTTRHGSFFEMLGNFSFGDYFKAEAIAFSWELLTGRFGLDPDALWVTVHVDDDEAERIWREEIGLPAERIQRMGEDNFWEMGETGPCGPCSEIYFDRGEAFGPPGGPDGGGEERYLEIWNLVFCQFERQPDGTLEPLAQKNIDTGAGLERILTVIEGADSVWETSLIRPLVEAAAAATGLVLGSDDESDVALRVIADHARTMTFLISDGVFPSNEGRGYVLRRIIRRAVLRAQQVSAATAVLAPVVDAVIAAMQRAYPALARDAELVARVVTHEEEAFRRTLRQGFALLDAELDSGAPLSGAAAFKLHDTYGFPIELTSEIASARGVAVDLEAFATAMEAQRTRARGARQASTATGAGEQWRAVLEEFGPTRFTGYEELTTEGRVLDVVEHVEENFVGSAGTVAPPGVTLFDVIVDRTPFYAEGGGQVGDTGRITGPSGTFVVLDTNVATEGLTQHTGYFSEGHFAPGEVVEGAVDAARRAAIRRNHTATHLLQSALRTVLGSHVTQQGSLVEPDRLRFDFSHFQALEPAEIAAVEEIVNDAVLENAPVETVEMGRAEAEERGAIAFFGERYGEVVRVVATAISVELCGGTHVGATGAIGPFRILSETSVGANTRRIVATTGRATFEGIRRDQHILDEAAHALHATPEDLLDAIDRVLAERRRLDEELRRLAQADLASVARDLATAASGGPIAARRDGLDPGVLRDLALAVRDQTGAPVGLVGTPDGTKVSLVVAAPAGSIDARSVAGAVAKIVGGGGGGSPELATAGGRDVGAIDAAAIRLGELLLGA
jgi:alanyl-tRNA synthetase